MPIRRVFSGTPHHRRPLFTFALLGLVASLLGSEVATAQTPPIQDRILVQDATQLITIELPGVQPETTRFPTGLASLELLPSGKLIGISTSLATPQSPSRLALEEVLEDGSLRRIGLIDRPSGIFVESPGDLATDSRGRLFLLSYLSYLDGSPTETRLAQLDPSNAAVLGSQILNGFAFGLAQAPKGLWTFSQGALRQLDPDSGDLGPKVADLTDYGSIHHAATDSAGRVYFTYEFVCSPPCGYIGSVDPETAAAREEEGLETLTFLPRILTIKRRCVETSTARCLQGGRFRAAVTFTDPAATPTATAADAQVAVARSGDTGLFYFFDPGNWELMVKVLDGCDKNGQFWVFSSASTDVGYTLEVTDTATLTSKTYVNPRGQVARTVADTQAFACNP